MRMFNCLYLVFLFYIPFAECDYTDRWLPQPISESFVNILVKCQSQLGPGSTLQRTLVAAQRRTVARRHCSAASRDSMQSPMVFKSQEGDCCFPVVILAMCV